MKIEWIAPSDEDALPQAHPKAGVSVSAGFPSPADDFMETKLDLNRHLVTHPAATFFVRVAGESMTGAGIHNGDTLVVDRALDVRDGDVVIAVVDGEFTVKRFRKKKDGVWLVAEHPDYPAIRLDDDSVDVGAGAIWGVVSSVVRKLR